MSIVERLQSVGFTTYARVSIIPGIIVKHYDVSCLDGTYSEWQASMSNAKEGIPHKNTIKLMGVVYYVGKDYCGTVS